MDTNPTTTHPGNAARPVVAQLANALGLKVIHHHSADSMTYATRPTTAFAAIDLFHDTLALIPGVHTGAVFRWGRIIVSFDPPAVTG